jgi:hypothetical protein
MFNALSICSYSYFSSGLLSSLFFFSRVTAVDGHYQIGVYTVRPIAEGEEITFDYNSVTEVSTTSSSCISYVLNYTISCLHSCVLLE